MLLRNATTSKRRKRPFIKPFSRRLAALRRSLRFIPGAWFWSDLRTGNIMDCSSDFKSMIGASVLSIRNRNISDFSFKGSERGWGLKTLDLELLSHTGRYEDVGLTSLDGVSLIVDIRVSHPHPFGKETAICLITDKSQQRQLQGELISKHQELRKAFTQLEERTLELEQTKEMLELKNKELGELSAEIRNTSSLATIGEITAELTHQLNNPLAAATGAARRLQKMAVKDGLDDLMPMLKLLFTGLERMRLTIDDVHLVYKNSRIPDTPIEQLDVHEHVTGTLALLQQQLEGHSVIVDIPSSLPKILGRKSLFQHVVVNLMDNAIESFSGEGILHIRAHPTSDKVTIQISDNGPGIPIQLHEKIFEAFYTTKESGSGLGLAAVKDM